MTTINKQISQGTDDCCEKNDTNIYIGNDEVTIGYHYSALDSYDGGLRWQSINIPQATVITSAKLSLYLKNDTGAVESNIRGIDEDNTATWTSGSRPSQRTKTTATITANKTNWNNWAVDSWIDIDITSVIQEIINRSGWSANNNLAVVIENTKSADTGYIIANAYEYTGNLHGAKLDIVYGSRTAKLSRSTMNVHPGVMFHTLTGGRGY